MPSSITLDDVLLNSDSPSPAIIIPSFPAITPPSAPLALATTVTSTSSNSDSNASTVGHSHHSHLAQASHIHTSHQPKPLRLFRSHLRDIVATLTAAAPFKFSQPPNGQTTKPRTALLFTSNSLEYVVCMFSAWSVNMSAVPVNPYLPLRDIRRLLRLANVSGAIVSGDRGGFGTERLNELVNVLGNELHLPVYKATSDWADSKKKQGSSGSPAGVVKVEYWAGPRDFQPKLEPRQTDGFQPSQDEALVMFSSGVVSLPKVVPLTHASLLSSLSNLTATMELRADDVTYVVMPLFHIHGLMGCLLSTLYSGGTAVIPPSFHPSLFKQDVPKFKVTWFSAVPSVHKILLRTKDVGYNGGARLRFIRSGSASLAPNLVIRLEVLFKCPVIEAYATTETSHQISSNYLPPGIRKPGSVGRARGCEVMIVDAKGKPTPTMVSGEVAVRGPTVFGGYDALDSVMNRAVFIPDPDTPTDHATRWFLTGDIGHLDESSYLYLHGRVADQVLLPVPVTTPATTISQHEPSNVPTHLVWCSPLASEAAALEIDGVTDVVAFGVPPLAFEDPSSLWKCNHINTRPSPSTPQALHLAVVVRPLARHHLTPDVILAKVTAILKEANSLGSALVGGAQKGLGEVTGVPSIVHIVDAVPKTATGKKMRAEMARRVMASGLIILNDRSRTKL